MWDVDFVCVITRAVNTCAIKTLRRLFRICNTQMWQWMRPTQRKASHINRLHFFSVGKETETNYSTQISPHPVLLLWQEFTNEWRLVFTVSKIISKLHDMLEDVVDCKYGHGFFPPVCTPFYRVVLQYDFAALLTKHWSLSLNPLNLGWSCE